MAKTLLKIFFVWIMLSPGIVFADVDTLQPIDDEAITCAWNITPSESLECWTVIDELGANDGDDTKIFITGDGKRADFEYEDWVDGGTVDSVVFFGYLAQVNAGGTIVFWRRYWSGDTWLLCTNADSDTLTIDTDLYTRFQQTWTVDPCDGEAWTADNINSTSRLWELYGYEVASKSQVKCTQLLIEVWYTPEVGGKPGQPIIRENEDGGGITSGGIVR